MATETLHISLPDTLKRYVEECVTEGGYGNTSEYIRELIRRDRDTKRAGSQAELEGLLLQGLDSLEAGLSHEVTAEYWDALRQEARQRLAAAQRSEQ